MIRNTSGRPANHRGRSIWAGTTIVMVVFVAVVAAVGTGCGRKNTSGDFAPGGEWLDDMRSRIKEQITDVNTATGLLAEVDNIEAELNALDAATLAYYTRLGELDRDYNSRRKDFETAMREFNTTRMYYRDRLFEIRFRMRDLTTPEQWQIVSDIEEGLLSQWQRDYKL